jgi:hypothetical protein
MKTEEIKQRYVGFPARVKDENTKITALAKGLVALNKTHASKKNQILNSIFNFRQHKGDLGTNNSYQLYRCNQRMVSEFQIIISKHWRFVALGSRGTEC